LSPADVRQKLIDKYGKPILRKGKELFQGVRIAGLTEDVSGNFVDTAEAPAESIVEESVAEAEEEKQETIVTEQESLTIIEPVVEAKKAGKPKKK
jgi:hypothetical protein